MPATASLIPELEEAVQGSPERCAEMLRRITDLFMAGASRFNEDHVSLFDDVLCQLVAEIEAKARAELSQRLAPVTNAPIKLMRRLAHDDDIAVAGPVLQQSPRLREEDLVAIAETKSQAHLYAISGRKGIGEAVTDVLVRRGDQEVARGVAANQDARLSPGAFSALVQRAEKDGVLAEKVGQRPDLPPHLFRDLLLRATEVVRRRLLAAAKPETRTEIQRVLAKISKEFESTLVPRDYSAAQAAVRALRGAGRLGESELAEFAKTKKCEETVATLSALCGVPIAVVDRLTSGERPDPVLILCKAAGFAWPTTQAILLALSGDRGVAPQTLEAAQSNFTRLSPSTAQRVVRFWQAQPAQEAVY